MYKILTIEDDPMIAKTLKLNLELEGYHVTHQADIKNGLHSLKNSEPHLLLLDLGLPDGHGFEVLKWVIENKPQVPVVILTAVTDEDSVVEGLQLGATDYIRKPFGNKELIARIKATLRKPAEKMNLVRYEGLELNLDKRIIKWNEKAFELNRREFDILAYLCQRPENIVSRDSLLKMFDKEGEIFDRTIDSHISHLRSKLKSFDITSIKISSVYGVGYRLERSEKDST